MEIFNNIRAEISRRRWSVDEFCKKIGINRERFYYWENTGDFPVSYLVKIVQTLEIPADELLKA